VLVWASKSERFDVVVESGANKWLPGELVLWMLQEVDVVCCHCVNCDSVDPQHPYGSWLFVALVCLEKAYTIGSNCCLQLQWR
jgi:hypothetical protein